MHLLVKSYTLILPEIVWDSLQIMSPSGGVGGGNENRWILL